MAAGTDPDRKAILDRRRRFIARALEGLTTDPRATARHGGAAAVVLLSGMTMACPCLEPPLQTRRLPAKHKHTRADAEAGVSATEPDPAPSGGSTEVAEAVERVAGKLDRLDELPAADDWEVEVELQDVSGSLGRDAIEVFVGSRLGGLSACARKAQAPEESLDGKLRLRVEVGGDGRVTEVVRTGGTLTDEGVVDCVTRKIQSWRFRGDLRVTLVLSFAGREQARQAREDPAVTRGR